MEFKLHSQYQPTGDQPQAIDALVRGVKSGMKDQVLLGVTGSGKTFTMANVIARLQRPALIIAHNKTLAAQLCRGVPRVLSRQRGGLLCVVLRLLSARGVHRLDPIPISKRTRPSTTRSTVCATARPHALSRKARRNHRRVVSAASTLWATRRNTQACRYRCARVCRSTATSF